MCAHKLYDNSFRSPLTAFFQMGRFLFVSVLCDLTRTCSITDHVRSHTVTYRPGVTIDSVLNVATLSSRVISCLFCTLTADRTGAEVGKRPLEAHIDDDSFTADHWTYIYQFWHTAHKKRLQYINLLSRNIVNVF